MIRSGLSQRFPWKSHDGEDCGLTGDGRMSVGRQKPGCSSAMGVPYSDSPGDTPRNEARANAICSGVSPGCGVGLGSSSSKSSISEVSETSGVTTPARKMRSIC